MAKKKIVGNSSQWNPITLGVPHKRLLRNLGWFG